jgi:hypothetical protein
MCDRRWCSWHARSVCSPLAPSTSADVRDASTNGGLTERQRLVTRATRANQMERQQIDDTQYDLRMYDLASCDGPISLMMLRTCTSQLTTALSVFRMRLQPRASPHITNTLLQVRRARGTGMAVVRCQ